MLTATGQEVDSLHLQNVTRPRLFLAELTESGRFLIMEKQLQVESTPDLPRLFHFAQLGSPRLMIRRILVGLADVRFGAAATTTAIELAKRHGASLTGISVLDVERTGSTGAVPLGAGHLAKELREHRIEEAQRIIEQVNCHFEDACQQGSVPFQLQSVAADPFQSMIDSARYHDVVVCGLRHLFEHGVIDEPPAELVQLVKRGVRPLLTVTDQYHPVKRVVIAYDGSIESAKAMKRFIQLHPWPDVDICIVTFEHAQGEPKGLLADAAAYCAAHGFEVETHYEPVAPMRHLLPYADRWGADLVVLGVSNRNILLRRILGETYLHTMQYADRPLFLAQ